MPRTRRAAAGVAPPMIRYLPLSPFVAAFVLLACSKADPVVDNAVAPSDAVIETSAEGLAAPANAAAAEAAQQAAMPIADDGMRWTVRTAARAADYGPVGAEPTLSVGCGASGELTFTRHRSAAGSDRATMSFTGNGKASSLPAAAVGGQMRAVAETSDMGRAVARTFDGPAPVIVSVGGASKLVVRPSAEARRIMAACL